MSEDNNKNPKNDPKQGESQRREYSRKEEGIQKGQVGESTKQQEGLNKAFEITPRPTKPKTKD